MFSISKLSEEEVISSSKLDTVYQHEFEGKKFFSIISEENLDNKTEYVIKVAPRTQLKVVYSNNSNDVRTLEITKIVNGTKGQKIRLDKICMNQLKVFLSFLTEIDINTYNERQTSLPCQTADTEVLKNFKKILENEEGENILKEILASENITSHDIVSTGYRKSQLEIFKKLLNNDYMIEYKETILNKPFTKDETAWQEFFTSNQWIFGYGLDYKFQTIIQDEFHASDTNAAGKEGVISDFLLGDSRFTSFVEIKLATTPLFGSKKNRSGCWRLSSELLNAYSQILEQKACGELKIEQNQLFDGNGDEIIQKAYNSKAFLVIGSLKFLEDDNCSAQEKKIKLKTFELFRRDSRNIEIITYDELYERAKFIVEHNS